MTAEPDQPDDPGAKQEQAGQAGQPPMAAPPTQPPSEDFTEEPLGPENPPGTRGGPALIRDYSPDRRREETRTGLATGLLLLLGLTVGAIVFLIGVGRLDASALAQSIFPSLVALTGTALGFYFGSQSTGGPPSGKPGG